MDRERFEHLLAAYGADFSRWPAEERAAAAVFAAESASTVSASIDEAAALDRALAAAAVDAPSAGLTARVLAATPKRIARAFDTRAALALAACAVFGVVLGYGAGLLAPVSTADDEFFTMAFEAPYPSAPGEEG